MGISYATYALAALVLLGSTGADARAAGIFGQLNGPDNVGPLPGADVKLCPVSAGRCRSAVTASDGSFQIRGVPPGKYKLTSPSSSGAAVSSEIVVPPDGDLNLKITAP
jgi:hypothetical protein